MKKIYYGLLSFFFVGLASCTKDEPQSSIEGQINVRITADQTLSGEESSRSGEEASVPDINDFGLTIESSDGKVFKSWENFSEFRPVSVVVGTYAVTASYGDMEAEGFDAVSYQGSTNVEVRSEETAEASVTCVMNKAKVSIAYTDEFKSYFTSYSASISSSMGNQVLFSADESRGAYFVPGDLGVYLEVTRRGVSRKVTLNPKNFTAEVKHEYRLTMDVDASAASLKIIFNDNPSSAQNVEINISDEALSAEPPAFTPYGFVSGNTLEVLEGADFSDRLEAYLNAPAGLAKCELVTNSAFLKNQGWPESVDLMNLTEEQSQKMTALGLHTKGLGINHDKIALIDFQQLVPNLICTSESDESHTFTLRATDVLTKVSEELSLIVLTRNNGFAVDLPESVPYESTSVTFPLTLDGDISKLKFYYDLSDTGVYQLFDASSVKIVSDGTRHTVTLTYPESLIDTEHDVKLKAEYGTKVIEETLKIEDPELTLSLKNGDADVWATKAYLQVTASAKSRASRTISSSTVEIQYKEGEEWKEWPNQSYDDKTGLFLLTGMGKGATETKGVSYKLRAAYKRGGELSSYSTELDLTTEKKMQIPNSNFEQWYTDSEEQFSWGLFEKIKWYYYYPYKKEDTEHWWATNNERAQAWVVSPVYVTTCPAVIYTYDTPSGSGKAAEIHTSGSGGEYASTSTNMYPKSAFAGSLFVGTYSWSDKTEHQSLGHAFDSRPLALSFWYKYKPYKTDAFKVAVELKNAETIIARGEYVPTAYSAEDSKYNKVIIPLNYTNSLLKATTISVQFLSTVKTSFTFEDLQKNGTLTLTDCADSWNAHFGSFLKIDDVELIYE